MNKIKLGANLTVSSDVNTGDIFMIEYKGDEHWYLPFMMIANGLEKSSLVCLSDGILFSAMNFCGLSVNNVCESVESEGPYTCKYVGRCAITVERQ